MKITIGRYIDDYGVFLKGKDVCRYIRGYTEEEDVDPKTKELLTHIADFLERFLE